MIREPVVQVGILKAPQISLWLEDPYRMEGRIFGRGSELIARAGTGRLDILLNDERIAGRDEAMLIPSGEGKAVFGVREVVVGIGFHWERKEDQRFQGTVKLIATGDQVTLVNLVPAETYLACVVSAEMSPESPGELLKAHAIISRSWLMSRLGEDPRSGKGPPSAVPEEPSGEEIIRWYDREDHKDFHVCADDHCQRYQGISRLNEGVRKAVSETAGTVLVYKGGLCDARFSKNCGGVTESYGNCWEKADLPYLRSVADRAGRDRVIPDLTKEDEAEAFIRGVPDAFCNTDDRSLIRQVLHETDRPGEGNFRWKVRYTQQEIASVIAKRSGINFGDILELEPVERGTSGRLVRLRIKGSRRTLIVGKELEIRKWLSPSHLFSAAFIAEKGTLVGGIPESFTLHGAGWGHGVGLCQIGAAAMASKGYGHLAILEHYYAGAKLEKKYG